MTKHGHHHNRGPYKPRVIPLNESYPSKATLLAIQAYNGVYNTLFPVKPWAFTAIAAGSYAVVAMDRVKLPYIPADFTDSVAGKVVIAFAAAYTPVFLLRLLLKKFVFTYKGYLFEKKPSVTTKLWAVLKKLLVRDLKTHTTDSLLPPLPVPALRDTIDRYLETVKPLLTPEEFTELENKANDFVSHEGWWLQAAIRVYALFTDNYVTPFWEKYAYLYGRDHLSISSSVAHVSMFKDPIGHRSAKVAHMLHIHALTIISLAKQSLQPCGQGMLYAGHYSKMICGTRIPGKEVDHMDFHSLPRHAVILYNGCFYKVSAFAPNGRLYTPEELTSIIDELLNRRDQPEGEERIAALTYDDRTQWANNRERFFLANKINATALKEIETAMIFFSIDDIFKDYDPEDPSKLEFYARSALTSSGDNQWLDKVFNVNFSKNGRPGGMTEHASGDGVEYDHVMEIYTAIEAYHLSYPDPNAPIPKPEPGTLLAQRLKFDVSEEMKSEIERVYTEYQPKKEDVDLASVVFREFGKGVVKKGKCSPDAFLQMAIQLANFRDQGKFVLTYEATSQRFYQNSRTETLRTVSTESCDFVNAMLDPESTDEKRLELLREASHSHTNRNRLCMTGQGVDRHLFVLYVMSKFLKKPHAFLDHYAGQKWLLSTSQPPTITDWMDEDTEPNNSWLGGIFAAVAHEGYGICYRFAGNHSIVLHVSSFKSATNTDSHRFAELLVGAIKEMAALFEAEHQRKIQNHH